MRRRRCGSPSTTSRSVYVACPLLPRLYKPFLLFLCKYFHENRGNPRLLFDPVLFFVHIDYIGICTILHLFFFVQDFVRSYLHMISELRDDRALCQSSMALGLLALHRCKFVAEKPSLVAIACIAIATTEDVFFTRHWKSWMSEYCPHPRARISGMVKELLTLYTQYTSHSLTEIAFVMENLLQRANIHVPAEA